MPRLRIHKSGRTENTAVTGNPCELTGKLCNARRQTTISTRSVVLWTECTPSTLRYRAEAPFVPLPPESNANSDSGTVNCEKPQAKQTKSFGNTQTPGSSTFLRLRKWMIISAANSDSLRDPHNRQDISASDNLATQGSWRQPSGGGVCQLRLIR